MSEIIVTPEHSKNRRGEEQITYTGHPTWQLVSENDDGTWTIEIPDERPKE